MKTMDRPDVEVVERLRREGVSRRSYAAALRIVVGALPILTTTTGLPDKRPAQGPPLHLVRDHK